MFKSYRAFDIHKPCNTKRLKVIHGRIGYETFIIVQLWSTLVVKRQNINNITELNSGGYRTPSTKIVMNTALRQIYGYEGPQVYQHKFQWFVSWNGIDKPIKYRDGMIIGGGSGIPFTVLN